MSEQQKVKRYVWMAGYTYYASGGFHDFKGSFNTVEEAEKAQENWLKENDSYTWSHICDLETGMMYGNGEGCNPMKMFQS